MNARMLAVAVVCLLGLSGTISAQQAVDPRSLYERVMAIVPFAGKGTLTDPRRPMYAPAPSALIQRTGIIAYAYVESDDHQFALVEYVAQNRAAFKAILADPTVKAFLKGRDSQASIEAVFKQFKKDFDFDHFGVRMIQ